VWGPLREGGWGRPVNESVVRDYEIIVVKALKTGRKGEYRRAFFEGRV